MPALPKAVEVAYSGLKDLILRGILAPGDPLPEVDLSERFGVSRTPVREALRRLAGEGLVVVSRYRANMVASFPAEVMDEVLQLRALVESFVTQRAVAHLTADDIARLERLHMAMCDVVEKRGKAGLERFTELNEEFHSIIIAASRSPRAAALLDNAFTTPWTPPPDIGAFLKRACFFHGEIIAALRAGNGDQAALLMRGHILSFGSMG